MQRKIYLVLVLCVLLQNWPRFLLGQTSCEGRCGQWVTTSPQSCGCNEICFVYKTCCPDVQQWCPEVQRSAEATFPPILLSDNVTVGCFGGDQPFWTITSCQDGQEDNEDIPYYRPISSSDYDRHFKSWWNIFPVVDVNSSLVFRNCDVYKCVYKKENCENYLSKRFHLEDGIYDPKSLNEVAELFDWGLLEDEFGFPGLPICRSSQGVDYVMDTLEVTPLPDRSIRFDHLRKKENTPGFFQVMICNTSGCSHEKCGARGIIEDGVCTYDHKRLKVIAQPLQNVSETKHWHEALMSYLVCAASDWRFTSVYEDLNPDDDLFFLNDTDVVLQGGKYQPENLVKRPWVEANLKLHFKLSSVARGYQIEKLVAESLTYLLSEQDCWDREDTNDNLYCENYIRASPGKLARGGYCELQSYHMQVCVMSGKERYHCLYRKGKPTEPKLQWGCCLNSFCTSIRAAAATPPAWQSKRSVTHRLRTSCVGITLLLIANISFQAHQY